MMATVGGGLLMYAVHLLNKKIPEREYSVFGVLLAVAMFVPNMPLQMVFAQQTARVLATGRERELAGMIRLAWLGTFGLWLLVAVPALIFQGAILARWQITNPAGLWLVLPTILFSLWLPMFSGVMQGQQNFFWLGWQNIINSAGRLGLAAIAVLAFGGYAAGMFTGVCVGLGAAAGICIWQTRGLWSLPTAPFDRQNLLAQIIPLMLGFSAVQFFLSADTMFVQAYFPAGQTAFYVGAGTLSRALMWVVVPLATVMFPKIVHAEARGIRAGPLSLAGRRAVVRDRRPGRRSAGVDADRHHITHPGPLPRAPARTMPQDPPARSRPAPVGRGHPSPAGARRGVRGAFHSPTMRTRRPPWHPDRRHRRRTSRPSPGAPRAARRGP